MLVVETVVRIRREHAGGKSIRAIARDLRLSRKAIGAPEGAFTYHRTVQPLPRIGPFQERLDTLLTENEGLPRRDRLRMTRIHDLLQREGFEGSYDAVRRYASRWTAARRKDAGDGAPAFIPLLFQPGEAYQFDWSHEDVEIAGASVRVKVAHMRLCASRAVYVRAYPRETQEMVFDAHARGFAFFGGVPLRGIYDNMKTAVTTVFTGKDRVFNRRFLIMADHYMVEPTACSPAAGWEKGQVENQVQTIRGRFFQPRLKFASLEELNGWLEAECRRWAAMQSHPEQRDMTVAEALAAERPALQPMLAAFDGFHETEHAVTGTCLISFERNRYSVPASFANRPVSLRIYPDRLVVAAEGNILCEHVRVIQRSHKLPPQTIYDWRHYLAVIQRKPGALRNGAPFLELPAALRQLQDHMLRKPGGDREMVDILALVLHHDEQAVLSAVEMALAAGVPTKTHVLNLLHRLVDGKVVGGPPLDTPQALILRREPKANVERYDGLRAQIAGGRHAS
jgi:transposase